MTESSSLEELSLEAKDFESFLKRLFTETEQLHGMRNMMERIHEASAEPAGVKYEEVDAGGVRALWVIPDEISNGRVLLHNHAGGSVVTSMFTDRKLAGHLAKAAGARALVLDTRRAPESKHPAQLEDNLTAFRWLLSQGVASKEIVSIGHSIGGYLAISLALRLRDAQEEGPGAVVAISPWADPTMSDPTIDSKGNTDLVLSRDVLTFFRSAWLDDTGIEPTDPQVNLNNADLRDLPPLLVSWGTFEILEGEIETFARLAREAGNDVTILPVGGAQHSYVWSAGRVPETDNAIQFIGNWIRGRK